MNVRNLSLNRSVLQEGLLRDQPVIEQNRQKTAGPQGSLWQRTPESISNFGQGLLNTPMDSLTRNISPGGDRSAGRLISNTDDDWNDILGMDISEAMRRKALLDFGLEVSLLLRLQND
jgi:hypothetical protein